MKLFAAQPQQTLTKRRRRQSGQSGFSTSRFASSIGNPMALLRSILDQSRPFIMTVSLLIAFLAAWKTVAELLPFLNQVFSPKGDAQRLAIVAAALALAAGRA